MIIKTGKQVKEALFKIAEYQENDREKEIDGLGIAKAILFRDHEKQSVRVSLCIYSDLYSSISLRTPEEISRLLHVCTREQEDDLLRLLEDATKNAQKQADDVLAHPLSKFLKYQVDRTEKNKEPFVCFQVEEEKQG